MLGPVWRGGGAGLAGAGGGRAAREGRLAAMLGPVWREGVPVLAGPGEARPEAARLLPAALEVWGPPGRPGTLEYVRAATSRSYPQFSRIGELGPMLRSDPYEPDCAGVTGRWHGCHSNLPGS